MSFPLTKDMLKKFAPRAKRGAELYSAMEKILPKYDIDTPKRIAMFLAQCGHESGGFSVMAENLNYSAKALDKVFGKYFARAGRDAKQYQRQPAKIANVVYANRMGNGDTESGDGWKFRGRGYIQLTGHDNYTRFANYIDKDIDEAIEYLETVEGAIVSACWFWKTNGLNELSDAGDIRNVTRRINGGFNGLKDREHHYHKALGLFGSSAPAPKRTSTPSKGSTFITLKLGDRGDEVAKMQTALGITADGVFGTSTRRAVKVFQRSKGLTPDGVAGPNTLTALYR